MTVLIVAGSAFAQDGWQIQRLVAITKYPMLPRMALIQGTVELRCSISPSGGVNDCKVNSGHPLLSSAAVENVKLWTFRLASENGESNDVRLIYTFDLAGAPVRGEPRTEFSFEFPNHVTLVSQPACADHAPCTPEERQGRI